MPILHEAHIHLECHPDGCCFLAVHSSPYFGKLTTNEKVPPGTSAVAILYAMAERIYFLADYKNPQWYHEVGLFEEP